MCASNLSARGRAALECAQRGWFVFPCHSITPNGECSCRKPQCKPKDRGKHPIPKNGLTAATRDEKQIAKWWTRCPDANVAVATQPSGLIVVDVDVRGIDGRATLAKLQSQFGPLPDTLEVRTGSGGTHLWFDDGGRPVKGTIGKFPGVDIRSRGNYVIVPPSANVVGEYSWVSQRAPSPLPSWLRGLLEDDIERNQSAPERTVKSIPNGVRHGTLTSLAGTLRRDGLEPNEIEAVLLKRNANLCNPPLEDREVQTIARDIGAKPTGTDRPLEPSFTLIDDEQILKLPDPKYLVQGVLMEKSLAEFYGPEGVGKTFVSLDLALSLATGDPWLGHPVQLRGPVVYIAGEGQSGMKKRVAAWKADRRTRGVQGVHFIFEPVDLFGKSDIDRLIESLRTVKPVAVVIDTLSRVAVGANENASQDMGLVVSRCDRIRREIGAAVILLHHPARHTKSDRGSNSVRCAADTVVVLKEKGDGVEIACEKQKDDAPFPKIEVALQPVHVGDATSCVVQRHALPHSGRRGVLPQELTALRELAQFQETGARPGQWKKATSLRGITERTHDRMREALVRKEFVRKDGSRYLLVAKGWQALADDSAATSPMLANSGLSSDSEQKLSLATPCQPATQEQIDPAFAASLLSDKEAA